MIMNWEAIGTIGEIVGSIAVVISLIYVSLQIRHANKQSELDALRYTWGEMHLFADKLSESLETASIVNRGRSSLESLDENEYLIFEHIHHRLLSTIESWHMQVTVTSQPGPYLDNQLNNMAEIIKGYMSYPGTRELWRSFRPYYQPIAELVDKNLDSLKSGEINAG
jgi:hypothetical protein